MKRRLAVLVLSLAGLVAGSGAHAAGLDDAFALRYDNPEDVFALGSFITRAVEDGQYDQAISTLEEHLVRYPNDGRARLGVARLYANVGSWDLAREQAQAALESGQLSAAEGTEAAALARRANQAANGVEWFVDVGGGAEFTRLDVDTDTLSWRDRSYAGGYGKAAGAVRFDLGTPRGDAIILSADGRVVRRYEDAFLGSGPLAGVADGKTVTAFDGRLSAIYDIGLPVTAIDAARLQVGATGQYATAHPGIVVRSVGGLARVVLQPTVDTRLHAEYAYDDLSASTGISADSRHRFEVGASLRLEGNHIIAVAARGSYEYTGSARAGMIEEAEISYTGIVPIRPFGTVWSHEISLSGGQFTTFGTPPGPAVALSGDIWRAEWAHVFQIDNRNRIELSYSATRRDFDQAAIAGRASTTHTVALGYMHRF